MEEMEIQQLRHLAQESEKHKRISEAASLFVLHHKAFKKLVMTAAPEGFFYEAAKINVSTYLDQLVKVCEAEHGA